MSEWLKEAVLKTVEPKGSVGSNPTLPAKYGVSGVKVLAFEIVALKVKVRFLTIPPKIYGSLYCKW